MRIGLVLIMAIVVLVCSWPASAAVTDTTFDEQPVLGKFSAQNASMGADDKTAGESIGNLCAKKCKKKKRRSKKRNGRTRRA